jgi:hypothetical protein
VKTQIIQLDEHDDIIAARDKLTWGQAGRILLVWPAQGRILNRRLDLLLLQRHAATLGAQLALVTRDDETCFYARQLGLSTFDTVRQAQTSRWRSPRRRRRLPNRLHPRPARPAPEATPERQTLPFPLRLGVFILSLLTLLALAVALLPSAEITLTPRVQAQEITLPITAGPHITALSLAGELPVQIISVSVEAREVVSTTGQIKLPDQTASGNVRFTNLTDRVVDIPVGTVVSTLGEPGLRFATTKAGQVAAGPGRSVSLPVGALAPGSAYNLPADSLQAIEGYLGLSVKVTNPMPTRLGSDRLAPGVSTADRTRLYNRLVPALRQTAVEELASGLQPDDLLVTTAPISMTVLELTYDPAGYVPANQLRLTLRLEFQTLVVTGRDLRALAAAALDANLPTGFTPLPGTLALTTIRTPGPGDGRSGQWQLYARRELKAQLIPAEASALVLGRTPAQARAELSRALPLAAEPTITLTPGWWPRLPVVPFRVQARLSEQP